MAKPVVRGWVSPSVLRLVDPTSAPPVFAVFAIHEAFVDQVPPERGGVVVYSSQNGVHLFFRVMTARFEALGQVIQSHEPTGAFGG